MRIIGCLIFSLLMIGCSPTSTLILDYNSGVSVSTTNHLFVDAKVFNSKTRDRINNDRIIQGKATYYLDKVVIGYANQLNGLHVDEEIHTGLHFEILSMTVKKGFTLNLIDPGPVFKLNMRVNIHQNGNIISTENYKTRVNMAQVVNHDKFWNWLSSEEIADTENQIITFERGLRDLYRDLYFEHLEISLTL